MRKIVFFSFLLGIILKTNYSMADDLYCNSVGHCSGYVGNERVDLYTNSAGSTYGYVGNNDVNLHTNSVESTYGYVGSESIYGY